MRASLSILGLYQRDPTLFDELELPGDMNKDVLIDSILYEAASLEAYYPDLIHEIYDWTLVVYESEYLAETL